jgi:hypothetical protein
VRAVRTSAVWALAVWIALSVVGTCHAASFDPNRIISNDNFRAANSMSRNDIQAFLNTLPGPLKSLQTTDYAGHKKPAAQIISEACSAWKISPKVMLTMLQKEQSLLTRTWLAKNTLTRAIGAGCPDARTNRYPGFGKQMWYGARLLDGYGEHKNGSTIALYHPGIVTKDIYQKPKVTLHPVNVATYKLYVYNPSIGAKKPYGNLSGQACSGNANFWKIYRSYFGDTFAYPQLRPVYRFYNTRYHTYLYTTSLAERYELSLPSAAITWRYEGIVFSWDTSATSGSVPVYRFRNKLTHAYSFTSSASLLKSRTSKKGAETWAYQGVAFKVARASTTGAVRVWRFRDRLTGAVFLTSSSTTAAGKTTQSAKRDWRDEGVVYYLPRVAR